MRCSFQLCVALFSPRLLNEGVETRCGGPAATIRPAVFSLSLSQFMFPFFKRLSWLYLLASSAFASGLPAGTDPVLLTVAVGEELREYSLADLQALGTGILETWTPWTERKHVYGGIPLRLLVQDAGLPPDAFVRLRALNGYHVTRPLGGLLEADAFLAFRCDGKLMAVRNKGPVWLLFPFSAQPHLNERDYRMAAVWMLSEITVVGR